MPFRGSVATETDGGTRERGFSLLQLVLAVTMLLGLAFVPPAWLAVRVNRGRVARAERDVRAIVEALQRFERDRGYLPGRTHASDARAGPVTDSVDLLVGPGEMPRVSEASGAGWQSSRTVTLSSLIGVRPTADPWGNRYTVNVGPATIWVLSAGPNGIVETPYLQLGGRARLSGDDVGVCLR